MWFEESQLFLQVKDAARPIYCAGIFKQFMVAKNRVEI
jgi:hypothetical protein